MKIVINTCYGGFSVSKKACEKLGIDWEECHGYIDLKRNDPKLVAVVEELGEKANGTHAALRITEIPDGVDWVIEGYDGNEWVAEKHRIWH